MCKCNTVKCLYNVPKNEALFKDANCDMTVSFFILWDNVIPAAARRVWNSWSFARSSESGGRSLAAVATKRCRLST